MWGHTEEINMTFIFALHLVNYLGLSAKEKGLPQRIPMVTRIFSFSQIVFNRLISQGPYNSGLCGKGL